MNDIKTLLKRAFSTKLGVTSFLVSTISLITTLVVDNVVPDTWEFKRRFFYFGFLIVIIGGVLFSQVVGDISKEMLAEERLEKKAKKHHKK